MIQVGHLTKDYGDRNAIKDLSFSVNKGEVVGFLGPNGAGKTTTMKIITGFMAPTAGCAEVAGFDVFENPLEVKKKIGYLPETPPVYWDMYVKDYLAFAARLKGVARKDINSMVDAAIEKTDLGEVRNRLIQNLSKGFRQRVGLAQALVSDPEVLILDEPTVGLDPKQVAEIRNLIQQLRGHHTIILSTHILPEVQATCERIIIINKGEIVAEDTLQGLSRRMDAGKRLVVRTSRRQSDLVGPLGDLNGVTGVRTIDGSLHIDVDENEATVEAVAEHVVKAGAGLLELKLESVGLEDIFIELTSGSSVATGRV